MHKKCYLPILIIFVCTTIAKANPVIMILPIETTGFSDYEESVINALVTSLVQTTEAYRIVDSEQVRLQLKKLDKTSVKPPEMESIVAIGKRFSADYFLTGTMGKVGDAYLINLQLVDTTTGITLATRSERSTTLQSFLELTINLVKLVLEQHYNVSSFLSEGEAKLWESKNIKILSRLSRTKLAAWAEKNQKRDALASGDSVSIHRALESYLSESLLPGLSYKAGVYGMSPISYESHGVFTDNPDKYIDTTGEYGISGSMAFCMQYRFGLYPYLAVGLNGSIGIRRWSYTTDIYENDILVLNFADQKYPLDYTFGAYLDMPVVLDSIGLVAGINGIRFFYSPNVMVGIRAGRVTMLYGTVLSPGLEWPHAVSLMYSIPSGAR